MANNANARLRAAREEIGLDQKGLAKALGVSASSISVVESGKTAVSKRLIRKLAERFSLNPIWLEHGQGEMFLVHGEAQPMMEPPADLEDARYVRVARYRVSVSAGNGAVNYDEAPDGYIAFPRSFLSEVGVTGTDCGLVEVTGDSMYRTVPNGALALVDFSIRTFVNGAIMVFRQGENVRVKKVMAGDNVVVLYSEHPSHDDELLAGPDLSEMTVIGQVRAVISKIGN